MAQLLGQRAEQVAAARAVACLAGLLQFGGDGDHAGRTHDLCCAFELVRRCRQDRKSTAACSSVDLTFGLNRCLMEFFQQRFDG